jgi:hypothetical protein
MGSLLAQTLKGSTVAAKKLAQVVAGTNTGIIAVTGPARVDRRGGGALCQWPLPFHSNGCLSPGIVHP